MEDQIVVKFVKIDGQSFENPMPRFVYDGKIGTWAIVVEAEKYMDFFAARNDQLVKVEVGMQLGTLLDEGKVKTWRSNLPNVPGFVAKIEGSDPMHFAER